MANEKYTPDNLGERKVSKVQSGHPSQKVPNAVFRYLNAEPGDYLVYEKSGENVVVRKVRGRREDDDGE